MLRRTLSASASARATPVVIVFVLAAAMTVLPAAIVALMTQPAAAQTAGQTTGQTTGQSEDEASGYVAPAPAEALHRMGAYLGTLQSFEVTSTSSIDLVTEDDRRIDLDGTTTYKVRRPDGFVIETRTDRKHRRFIYDGKRFTVYAPERGFYASVEAPPTIAGVLDAAWDKYGIVIPLEDIFHWGDPANLPTDYTQADYVGRATVDGVATDQYAFAGPDIEWQVWIQRGDKPLPLKIVIVDRTDTARPEFSATLAWNTNPRFMDSTFAFAPAGGDKPIPIADQSGAQ